MKTRKPNLLKSDHHAVVRGGWTNKNPEVRHGTRTATGFIMSMVRGNRMAGGRTAALANKRQVKKGWRHVTEGRHWKELKGRVIRACARSAWEGVGEDLDRLYYGEA